MDGGTGVPGCRYGCRDDVRRGGLFSSCLDVQAARLTSGLDISACNIIFSSYADGAGRGLHGRPLPEVPPPKEGEEAGEDAPSPSFGILPLPARRIVRDDRFFRADEGVSFVVTNMLLAASPHDRGRGRICLGFQYCLVVMFAEAHCSLNCIAILTSFQY